MANANLRDTTITAATSFAILLALTFSPFVPNATPGAAAATPEPARWTSLDLPASGETGGWALAPGSDVKRLAMAKDGALYAHADPPGTDSTLFRSADGGYSWASVGEVNDAIVAIALAPDVAAIIYYATASNVYKSADSGKTFSPLPPAPGGAGTANITITSLDIARLNGKSLVAVGTADSDSARFGGVYTLDESQLIPGWENTAAGNYDISAVTFSPNFASDRQLLAVATDEADTFVVSMVGAGGWNQLIGSAAIEGRAARAASVAFPDDYDASRAGHTFFVAVDTGTGAGDVYKIKGEPAPDGSTATDLDIGAAYNLANLDVSGLAVSGNSSALTLLAGAAGSTQVYASADDGATWSRSKKQPTGQSLTAILMTPDFASTGAAYAATRGPDSAFSRSGDGGTSWNQVSLMDARISSNGIIDLAVSPDYTDDQTLFMLTFDSVSTKHSLWRSASMPDSRNGGAGWERIFSATLPGVDSLSLVELSPAYGKATRTVFLAGLSNGTPAIWQSTDNGQTFVFRIAPATIDAWTIVSDNSLFLGSYNGAAGMVYSTENSGFFYSGGTLAGSQPLKSIALSPNYLNDAAILTGNSNGWVHFSSDNGTSFKPLPRDATAPPLGGSVSVAFDPGFATNNTVYAAGNPANEGVYRFIVGKSTKWERLDTSLPSGASLARLAVSADGVLYAANSQTVGVAANKGGIERSLNPTADSSPVFETVTRGLDDGVNLSGLWLAGNQLFSIDTQNTRVMTFIDSLATQITLISPADGSSSAGKSNLTIKWEAVGGATEYKWQLGYDSDFLAVISGFEGDTKATSARLPALDSDTTYYWRVRATKPVLAPWSPVRSFSTGLGSAIVAPELYSPKAGAENVSVNPLFQWSAISGADTYEIVVSANVSLANPSILRVGGEALPATAWQAETTLEQGRAYYWKVRGSGAGGFSAWSAVGAFITAAPAPPPPPAADRPDPASSPGEPVAQAVPPTIEPPSQVVMPPAAAPPASPPPAQSPPQPQPALPVWLPYTIGILALAMLIMASAVLLLVLKMRPS